MQHLKKPPCFLQNFPSAPFLILSQSFTQTVASNELLRLWQVLQPMLVTKPFFMKLSWLFLQSLKKMDFNIIFVIFALQCSLFVSQVHFLPIFQALLSIQVASYDTQNVCMSAISYLDFLRLRLSTQWFNVPSVMETSVCEHFL